MLKKYRQFFESLLFCFDLGMIALAWIGAYAVRARGWLVPFPENPVMWQQYLALLPIMVPIWAVIFRRMGLYRPHRTNSHLGEAYEILRASTLATLAWMVIAYALQHFAISRLVFVYFWILSTIGLIVSRLLFREVLRVVRRHGYNLRHILIVGTEDLGQQLSHQISRHPEFGFHVVGFLTRHSHEIGQRLHGAPVLGRLEEVQNMVRTQGIDQVFIALPLEAQSAVEKLVQALSNEMVDIRIIPDLYQYVILRGSIEEFEGLPVVTLSASPMYGWNSVLKRTVDLCLGLPLLALSFPLLGLLALCIKLTSRGPVFYLQERMGFDGQTFRIAKFRTMHLDAERHTGAVWATADDPRCTPLGAVLRRTSLDELPQLWNVLKGEMSLVGPRPERPELIAEFRHSIPRYMLRHRVKAGMTGWAQVHGWRGQTSLEHRIEHDLYYIQHWSLFLDFHIDRKSVV